ncbi:MAG: U32 family peptidase [Bacteroidales bacterium]|nr:U32 family peptidase [Bacteroidales bacterium]
MFVVKKIELLSPAKNLEVGVAAINHGADAVYIGGPGFGAREKVSNSIYDIEKLCRHAAIYDAKVYVTLNTLLFDNELDQARKIAWDCYNAGVDALIVQDMALLMMDLPPIALHASTQCNNTTPEKVKFLEDVGFKQVVLARELSINEIKEIRSKTTVPLEFFVHGALCVSYSGQCYLSHVIGHRSANRGACAQPCRLKWNLEDENGNTLIANRHLLSLRDMNNSKNLEELIDAGITSFKIEGRLKDADYVKNTTAYYRQALDKIIEIRDDLERASRGVSTPSFVPNLEKSFSRGFTDYFAHGRQKIDSPFTPKSMGEHVGSIQKIDGKRLNVNLLKGIELHNGDGLCFLDENNELQGFNVNGVDGNSILTSFRLERSGMEKSQTTERDFSTPLRYARNDKLYRNYDIVWQKSVETSDGNRKIAIRLKLSDTAEGLKLSAFVDDSVSTDVEMNYQKDIAKNPEKSLENIRTKLSQWGDTKFTIESVDIDFKEIYFIPNSVLGELKRQLVVKLEETLVKRHFDCSEAEWRNHRHLNDSEQNFSGDFSTTLRFARNDGLSYLGNVTNSLSRQFYENHGVTHIDDGLEKSMPEGEIVVMTTKHCIRYANGMCAKETGKPATPLFISNDCGRFRLDFDCKNCLMKVIYKN